ncbi:MAG: hypothetical protein WC838_07105 [Candidatus Margulisiibacteriota bacterium]|jgi:flagellar hook protein FlgE
MLSDLSSLQNSIAADQFKIAISTENIANSNLIGYKRKEVEFTSVFSKLLKPGTENSQGGLGGTNPQERSMGLKVTSVSRQFTAGALTDGTTLDLAFTNNNTFFVVSPDGGNRFLYSRSGKFRAGSNNKLVTADGLPVYGYKIDEGGFRSNVLEQIDLGTGQTPVWDAQGKLTVTDSVTGTTKTIFQIAITAFANPSGLTDGNSNTFKQSVSSGSAYDFTVPGTTLGTVVPGKLEEANVDAGEETLTGILPTQRYLQAKYTAVQAILNTTDKFLQAVAG